MQKLEDLSESLLFKKKKKLFFLVCADVQKKWLFSAHTMLLISR